MSMHCIQAHHGRGKIRPLLFSGRLTHCIIIERLQLPTAFMISTDPKSGCNVRVCRLSRGKQRAQQASRHSGAHDALPVLLVDAE